MKNGLAIHMLTEKKYPLSQEMISKMLKKKLEVDHESSHAIELLRFIRSQNDLYFVDTGNYVKHEYFEDIQNLSNLHVMLDDFDLSTIPCDVEKLKKKNKYLTKQMNLMMKLFRSDDKFSQMLNQYESTPEFGSRSDRCGDDEVADDEDGGEDEEDEEDGDS
ncbi:hypothetical protein Tco_1313624 [Tanacetum coccineum]